jgi:RHS repeat-associated protein
MCAQVLDTPREFASSGVNCVSEPTHYNYFRSYDSRTGRYSQSDPIDLQGGWNKFAYVESNPLLYVDPLGLRRGGNGKGPAPPPTFGFFGCLGLFCTGSQTSDSEAQLSLEAALGGGIEICDAPPPPPEENMCKKSCGFYDRNCTNQAQPPGIPIPKKFGGLFFGPGFKRDGRFCVRIGPHVSVPLPTLDLGGMGQ